MRLHAKSQKAPKRPKVYGACPFCQHPHRGRRGRQHTYDCDTLIDELAPPVSIDASDLTGRERRIVVARAEGETLAAIGKEEGVSKERVRQLHRKAQRKLNSGGNVAQTCIRSLLSRRGYRPPSWAGASSALQERRFEQNKYKGRCLAPEEIAEVVAARPDLLLTTKPEQRYTWKRGKTKRWGGSNSPGESILYHRGKGPWRKYKGPSEGQDREIAPLLTLIPG